MPPRLFSVRILAAALAAGLALLTASRSFAQLSEAVLDQRLIAALKREGFTGRIEMTLTQRLGRPLDARAVHLGRLLWFDSLTGLNDDNSCAGCHSPTRAMGDTQPIAIGIENNGIVGPNRTGPRNSRRSPSVINTAFYPNLMWNSRFAAVSQNPFDNSKGFSFPAPEGLTLSHLPHLLTAQAFIPPTERNEVAGFDFPGTNHDIREEVLNRLNATPNYRQLFSEVFPAVRAGERIDFDMFGRAIAEFEFALTFANAPIDQYARGDRNALTRQQKEGALLFFNDLGCVSCHAVAGASNEMFSDFRTHCIGVPQVTPAITNSVFDGPGANEDFGLEQATGDPNDRYEFRTSPLRNVAMQAAFFHNGAFTTLEDAIAHHLNARASALNYSPVGRLPDDLTGPTGPAEPMVARLDVEVSRPVRLSREKFACLVEFVRFGLLDARTRPQLMRRMIPNAVPSGRPVDVFE